MTAAPTPRSSVFAFRRNLVVAASAGTGKTHSLVGLLVHLLLGASDFGGVPLFPPIAAGRLLATTFSRKAAAEIRARLSSDLERLAALGPMASPALPASASPRYRSDLESACRAAGVPVWSDDEVAARARRALATLPRARITTLHGFATSLVRDHAIEAGLAPGFEVEDEADTRARVDEAIRGVLASDARRGDARAEALVAIAGGVDQAVVEVARALGQLEEDGRGASSLEVSSTDAAAEEARVAELLRHARALRGEPKVEEHARTLVGAFEAGDLPRWAAAVQALFEVRRWKNRSPEAEAFFEFVEGVRGATKAERATTLVRRFVLRERFAVDAARARGLLVACEQAVAASGRAHSVLGFGEVMRAARDLLRDRPDLAAEVGGGLDALLVDEFQDTSRLQRDVVQLLWGRDPSSRTPGTVPSLAELRPRGLFVVGDRKQSIYGFRGADVGVFAEFCVGLAGEPARRALGIPAGVAWEPSVPSADFVSLVHNRRGAPELLAFANALSAVRFRPGDDTPELHEIRYVAATEDLVPPPSSQAPPEEDDEGSAPSEPPAAVVPRTVWIRLPTERASTPLEEARAIAAEARAILDTASPRVFDAPPRPRDLAVLAETNAMLDAAAYALSALGIPYVVAGKGFYGAREVQDLVAMLAVLVDPGDRLALMEVLRGPWAGVRDETLLGLTDPERGLARLGPAWDEGPRRALVHEGDRPALRELRRVVEPLHLALDRLGPGQALRTAARELGFLETLVQLPRGVQRVANARKLLALADAAPRAGALLDELRKAREDTGETEASTFSDEDDAVRLLTVHASKGLAFPIVFIPQVGKLPRNRAREALLVHALERRDSANRAASCTLGVRVEDVDGLLYEGAAYEATRLDRVRRERAERQRLTYVAATRASHAMIFVGDRQAPAGDTSRTYADTTAASLAALADDRATAARIGFTVRNAPLPRAEKPLVAELFAGAASALEAFTPPPLPAWETMAIGATALQDFAHCARRFELVHVLDLPERAIAHGGGQEPGGAPRGRRLPLEAPRDATASVLPFATRLDARREGTLAHAVLERVPAAVFGRDGAAAAVAALLERQGLAPSHPSHAVVRGRVLRFLRGRYASTLADAGAALLREHPFHIALDDGGGHAVLVGGAIDLLVRWPDGSVDVIDYKSARGPAVEPHTRQLDLYARAARGRFPDATSVRAGLVFLGARDDDGDEAVAEPVWLPPEASRAEGRPLARLGAELLEARWSGRFPRVPIGVCRAIHCGYVEGCHPRPLAGGAPLPVDDPALAFDAAVSPFEDDEDDEHR